MQFMSILNEIQTADEGNILACLEQIELGESYELCLTNKVNSALR